jgi:carbamate kinase
MPLAVVAIGGNSLVQSNQTGTIPEQFANAVTTCAKLADLIDRGWDLVLTHGNGPQVGNVLTRVELAAGSVYTLPLDICDADTEGGMGYMIEQSLQNRLRREGIGRDVCTMVTQVVVDRDDPSILNPSKPIGPYYQEAEVEGLRARGWTVRDDAGRGYRRFVPSPIPRSIVNRRIIKNLVDEGTIVVAAGGGGVPVYAEKDGALEGVDAVIDKDRASAVLARDIGAATLMILTQVDKVALNYKKPDQRDLDSMTLAEARKYLAEGHFAAGSMGPKVEAAVQFLEGGGEQVIITSLEKAAGALGGTSGTRIAG